MKTEIQGVYAIIIIIINVIINVIIQLNAKKSCFDQRNIISQSYRVKNCTLLNVRREINISVLRLYDGFS